MGYSSKAKGISSHEMFVCLEKPAGDGAQQSLIDEHKTIKFL